MKIKLPSKYAERRQMAYPTVEEQLDALWHGMDKVKSKRIEPFYSLLKAVKEQNPKESST